MVTSLILVAAVGLPSDRTPVVAVMAAPVRVVARVVEARPARKIVAAVANVQPARRLIRARPMRSMFQNRQPVRRVARCVFRRR